jgi:hypothetical protein
MLKTSEFSKTTSKLESNKIILTLEIEKKLENMSTDLLSKTVIYYENYNYDISIKIKAEEILSKRGVSIEIEEIITTTKPAVNGLKIVYGLLVLLFIAGYIYFKNNPSIYFSTISIILCATIWIVKYYIKNEKH